MTATLEYTHDDYTFAFAFRNAVADLERPLEGNLQKRLDWCESILEAEARKQDRNRRVRQALEAAFDPDPEVRRYARLERRAEHAKGAERVLLQDELDRLGESMYCRKYDC